MIPVALAITALFVLSRVVGGSGGATMSTAPKTAPVSPELAGQTPTEAAAENLAEQKRKAEAAAGPGDDAAQRRKEALEAAEAAAREKAAAEKAQREAEARRAAQRAEQRAEAARRAARARAEAEAAAQRERELAEQERRLREQEEQARRELEAEEEAKTADELGFQENTAEIRRSTAINELNRIINMSRDAIKRFEGQLFAQMANALRIAQSEWLRDRIQRGEAPDSEIQAYLDAKRIDAPNVKARVEQILSPYLLKYSLEQRRLIMRGVDPGPPANA